MKLSETEAQAAAAKMETERRIQDLTEVLRTDGAETANVVGDLAATVTGRLVADSFSIYHAGQTYETFFTLILFFQIFTQPCTPGSMRRESKIGSHESEGVELLADRTLAVP